MTEDGEVWSIKEVSISLGGEGDSKGFLVFEIFDDYEMNIFEGDKYNPKWFKESISIEAAIQIRDFLNYAIPKGSHKSIVAGNSGSKVTAYKDTGYRYPVDVLEVVEE